MTFIISVFQFHHKIEHKQLKSNTIKHDMFKFDIIFPNLKKKYGI